MPLPVASLRPSHKGEGQALAHTSRRFACTYIKGATVLPSPLWGGRLRSSREGSFLGLL